MENESDLTHEHLSLTRTQATEADFDIALRIHHAAYKDVVEQQFGKFVEAEQDRFFAESWNPETHELILDRGRVVGYCSVEYSGDEIYIHELVLSPEDQGKGIGTIVLNNIIDEANKKSLPVRLQVLKANEARRLYQKLGFREFEESDTHFKMEYVPIGQKIF